MPMSSLGVVLGTLFAFALPAQSGASTEVDAVVAQVPAPVVNPSEGTPSEGTPSEGLAPILEGMPEHGLPGAAEGTERWIVHFERRSFDLSAFRQAVRSGADVHTVAAIVQDFEQQVVADQKPFADAVQKLGGQVVVQWWLVNACAIEIPFERLDAVRALPNVRFVQPEMLHEPMIKKATDANNHNSDYVNQTLKATGLGVACGVMDTGQDENMGSSGRPHRMYFVGGDINNKTGGGIGGSRLLVNRRIGALGPDDFHSHGTGCASIAAGSNWGISAADDGHAPMAGICGYAIANQTSGGGSSNTTMASAWQSMASDKVQYKIVAANLSYGGSPNPLDVAQQALDSAALNADIMVCVAAGNSSSSTSGSQSAVNGLAAAAISADSHAVASFSSRGPISGDSQRFYPDIAACGVSTVMAKIDNENGTYVGSGTSMASPQVCGAATVLRGRFTALTALETKTVLLASTLDISEKNTSAPYDSRNAYGMGLLRDDRAFAIAGAGDFVTAKLDTNKTVWTQDIPVKNKQTYAIAIAWHRTNLTSTQWADLALEVLDGTTVIAASDTPRNLYELVRVFSQGTSKLTLRVTAKSFGSGATAQDFAIAWTEAPNSKQDGVFTSLGAGCAGSGQKPSKCASLNETNSLRNSSGYPDVTYLLEFRPATNLQVKGFQIKLASRTSGSVTLPTYLYSSTTGGAPNQVLASGTMQVGSSAQHYATVLNQTVNLASGQLYFIGFRNANPTITVGTISGGTTVPYWRNNGSGGSWVRFSTLAWSYIIDCLGGSGAVPTIASNVLPEIGGNYDVELSFAAGTSAALLWTGFSSQNWSGLPLPFDLAPLGAAGCQLRISLDIMGATVTSTGGDASLRFVVPNAKDLIGFGYHHQWMLFDAAANQAGLVMSEAASVRLGGRP